MIDMKPVAELLKELATDDGPGAPFDEAIKLRKWQLMTAAIGGLVASRSLDFDALGRITDQSLRLNRHVITGGLIVALTVMLSQYTLILVQIISTYKSIIRRRSAADTVKVVEYIELESKALNRTISLINQELSRFDSEKNLIESMIEVSPNSNPYINDTDIQRIMGVPKAEIRRRDIDVDEILQFLANKISENEGIKNEKVRDLSSLGDRYLNTISKDPTIDENYERIERIKDVMRLGPTLIAVIISLYNLMISYFS